MYKQIKIKRKTQLKRPSQHCLHTVITIIAYMDSFQWKVCTINFTAKITLLR
uniref:Uncharacterized protein n=1 Tax=Arundo donax TaxID=35708 RepID=A0A0A9DWJ8_ARUDO